MKIRLLTALASLCVSAIAGQNANITLGKAQGSPAAPIRIELYSDYQCPGCKTLHEQTIHPLIADYVNTGKVYLVNHEFPLPMHTRAREAACLACAAEKIGKYRQVADQIFLSQAKWVLDGNLVGPACTGLTSAEAERLVRLAKSAEVAKMVDDDIRAGQAEKIGATPTMVVTRLIRRYPIVGPVSYPVLRKFLDSLLN
jgi:protein-disulfide isomerase